MEGTGILHVQNLMACLLVCMEGCMWRMVGTCLTCIAMRLHGRCSAFCAASYVLDLNYLKFQSVELTSFKYVK
jgi:hypothetical protein